MRAERPQPSGPDAPAQAGAAAGARYRENVPRDLIGISRDLQARVRRALSERGFDGLRPSFGPFLAFLMEEGRPLSDFASELAISKQACSQLAKRIEQAGYLERRPNPDDRRSRLMMLTPRGRELVLEGVRIILETEADYAAIVGARDYERFGTTLAALYRGLELPSHADPTLITRAGRSVGVLPLIAVRIQRELMQATIARGHPGLKMSHGQVIPFVANEGGRIHEIARMQRVSRQAIHAIAQELEELGYLEREPDPSDGRGVLLRLSPRGHALMSGSLAAVDELESEMERILGTRRFVQMAGAARKLYLGLQPAEEPDAEGNTEDIHELASALRRQLGKQDAARLAELLEPGAHTAPAKS